MPAGRRGVDLREFAEHQIMVFDEDPHVEIVPAERTDRALTAAEQSFRDAWLKTKQ